ncbi:MAG TPA: hypothetical protein VM076_24880 [Gemmatimonadaceae bacterium]|nr:hypothetical protein [Gemmatimonadaceae bacterium]
MLARNATGSISVNLRNLRQLLLLLRPADPGLAVSQRGGKAER